MTKISNQYSLTNVLFADAVNGRVGIGTTSPSGKLHLTGESSGADLLFMNTSGANTNFAFKITGAASDYLTLRRNHSTGGNIDIMSWTYGGNVGIGTTSPAVELHVKASSSYAEVRIDGASGGGASLEYYSNGTQLGDIYCDTSSNMIFRTNPNNERMRINSDGTMILGGTSSSGTAGSGSGRGNFILSGSISNVISFNNNSTSVYATIYSDSGEMSINSSSFMQLRTGGNDRVRITNGGNILMGTTTDNGYKLNVSGNIYASSNIYAVGGIGAQGNIYTDYGYGFGLNSNTQVAANGWNFYVSSSFSNYLRFFYGGTGVGSGSAKFQIDTGGGYTGLSDVNKKKDISLSTLGLAEIMQLKPSTFKFKDDEKEEEQIGFIAQEVKDIIPQAYYEDEEGDDKFIGLKQTAFIPVLVKAIQEQQLQINELKALLNAH